MSAAFGGGFPNGQSNQTVISDDGQVVAFVSDASDLLAPVRRSSFVTTIPTNPNAVTQASILASLLVAFGGDTGAAGRTCRRDVAVLPASGRAAWLGRWDC